MGDNPLESGMVKVSEGSVLSEAFVLSEYHEFSAWYFPDTLDI